jgi:iron complex transport system substrate-binding protein
VPGGSDPRVVTRRGPQRIVCLAEKTTETLYLLGEQDRVVGISGFTVRPPQARREKPKVSFTSAKIDRIVALKPDLVLGFSQPGPAALTDGLRRLQSLIVAGR